ncbi:hypothetical protein P4I92_24030 [Bacillus cereus]|uniref:hypothetical protein n=1 Tax=Bacillus albus TaxID=2026189 RepID=UPI00101EBD37|nr:hypothetical protein [Bacillus albus]
MLGFENVVATDFTSGIDVDQIAHRTNMKFTEKKKKEQQFLMHGPKFFDESRKFLTDNSKLKDYALPASALATYILLHFKVDDLGILPRNFVLKELEKASGIPYSTIHTGFQILQTEGLVEEILVGGKIPHYKICNYDRLNRTAKESTDKTQKLSYCRLPNYLLETSILKELVTHRDNKGIIELLNLINAFTRALDKDRNKYSVEDYTLTRAMKTLKVRLGRSAKKVRQYLDIIAPIFDFKVISEKVRNPREARITRIRKKIQQIVIINFEVRMNPACVVENDRAKFRQAEAKMRKEAISRLNTAHVSLTSKDRKDIHVAFKNEISKIAAFVYNPKLQKNLMTYSMTYALDQFQEYVVKTKKKVNSIGGFIRAKLRESLTEWNERYLDDDTRLEIIGNLISNDIDVPDALRHS